MEESILETGCSLAELEHDVLCDSVQTPTSEGVAGYFANDNVLSSLEELRNKISDDVVTENQNGTTFASPFRLPAHPQATETTTLQLPLIYCDQTASNRPVQSIENYIQQTCLPLYGNTHTNTSITGSQSTALVAEARQIVAEFVNAKVTGKAKQDVVLFAGAGATAAVELLIDCMGLQYSNVKPVVFCGPFEHHSNMIPWREAGCQVVMVPVDVHTGNVDYTALEHLLQQSDYQSYPRIGTFTAASNVTGVVCDTLRLADLLHRHDALAFFDYATAAPYTAMDMNPAPTSRYPEASTIAKDAIFFSPHKLLGGINTPGVLVVKRNLVSQANAPRRSGGGTVFYVTHQHHRFLSNRIERNQGGTPNVVGILRVGLACLLKRQAEEKYQRIVATCKDTDGATIPGTIYEHDCHTHARVVHYLQENAPKLVLLGTNNSNEPRLPIFSFLIRCGQRFLHYNYVCAVLNDVFGIQSRGGCQCAGPYSQQLLGLTLTTATGDEIPTTVNHQIEQSLIQFKEQSELLRPGYTRLSLPFKGLRLAEVDHVINALVWVSENAWALMCQYRCNHRTGEWRHASRQGQPLGRTERKWLSHYNFSESTKTSLPDSGKDILLFSVHHANLILEAAKTDRRSIAEALKTNDAQAFLGDGVQMESLRWYIYPKECAAVLAANRSEWTNESVEPLLGALYPVAQCDRNTDVDALQQLADTSRAGDRKRKNVNVGDSTQQSAELRRKKTLRDKNSWGSGDFVLVPASDAAVDKIKVLAIAKGESCPTESSPLERVSPRGDSSVGERLPVSADDALARHFPLQHVVKPKKSRFSHTEPPKKLFRTVTQAVMQWDMLLNGDKLLLGLSGGKDSLSLLHCLLALKRKLPVSFDIEVCTIDPMTSSFDPSPLIPYVQSLGLKYHYIRDDIVSRASTAGKEGTSVSSLCAYCARMKRGNLYTCARENKCNKLVLAQHLDDCAESLMMSMMHNGFLRTMKANYKVDAGDISVIRPLIYCRESLMTEFSTSAGLPVINENCPACFEEPKERARIKKMLSREETLYPNFYDNIRRALLPLMHDDSSNILRSYTEAIVSKSRQGSTNRSSNNKTKRHRMIDRLDNADFAGLCNGRIDGPDIRALECVKGSVSWKDEADSTFVGAPVGSHCTLSGCEIFE